MLTRLRMGTLGVVATVALLAGCGTTAAKDADVKHSAATPAATTTTTAIAPPAGPPTPSITTARTASTTVAQATTTTTVAAAPTTTTTTTTTVKPPPAVQQAQQDALARVVASYPHGTYATSVILHTGPLSYVAVAHDPNQLSSVIDIYQYQSPNFVAVARNLGSSQSLDPVDPTSIETGDITGAQFPDFLVPLQAGDHDNGVLVSFAGGSWHLVGLSERTGAGASDELVEPTIIGNQITQSVNDCDPSCAQGTYSVTTYDYDSATGQLDAVGPTVESPTP